MKHMTINGIGGKVHYWISRPNNNSKGALVFTHGLTANHTMYEKQVEYFKNDYVVITWDVPLHGLSIPYKEFSYEITARIYWKGVFDWYVNGWLSIPDVGVFISGKGTVFCWN